MISPSALTTPGSAERARGLGLADLAALALGIGLTLCLGGYQFGQSNHAVYLPAALHRYDPNLLGNDWFTSGTLQYHTLFTSLSAALFRFELIRPAFFIGYIALAILFHLAWLRLAWLLGGSRQTYVLSVGLYYLSAGGLGLGMYQFLQDGSFLPSNIANVAMLWGIYFLGAHRPMAAAGCLGLAGLFHLNFALVGPLLWGFGGLMRQGMGEAGPRAGLRGFWPSLLLAGFCAMAIYPVLPAIFSGAGRMGLGEFIDLYVRVRHPHHYDPSSWPWYLWVAFLWPIPFGAVVWRRGRMVLGCGGFFLGLQVVALVFAGLWYVSESLVQLSLYRFSIYVKLLSCIAAGYAIWDGVLRPRRVRPVWAYLPSGVLLMGCVGILMVWHTWPVDLWPMPRDSKDYRTMCEWVREHTPVEAVFLVPPDEQSFRVQGRRAIVVNFKGVPQLSGELPEWRARLEAVLGMEDLRELPRRFDWAAREIRRRYDALGPEHLIEVAERYGAEYVVTSHPVEHPSLVEVHVQGDYHLYRRGSTGGPG